MLIFRGLTGNILLGQFVGPFPKDFQTISSGFIPDFLTGPLSAISSDGFLFGPNFRWTSMLIGLVGAALLIFTSARRWRRDKAHTMETEPFALFVGKNAIFAILIVGFSYLLASYRGLPERADHHGRADPALYVRHHAHDDRPPHLRARRQSAGGAALRHPDRAADLRDLRQHGRAGGARRA